MATIFDTQPGAVAVLPTDEAPGLPLSIDSVQGSWYGQFKSILTGLSVALDGNVQFTHTLDNTIYVYAFGDRISALRVSGLSFQDICGNGGSGTELILSSYQTNRVAANPNPIQVQIGTTSAGLFRGSMIGLRQEIAQPEAKISQFTFLFQVIPSGS